MGIHWFYHPGSPSSLSHPSKPRRFNQAWETALLAVSAAIYLATRLIGLARFPIYFFSDEAVQVVLAQDFIRDAFHGYDHVFFPTYFLNTYQYNLGTSVYLQVIPFLLFGKSIFITRAVPVLVSLIAALSVGLILKEIFKSPYPWTAVLLLSITPAWFLHSRTAFETSLATSFYAGFLYFYMRYRSGKPRSLYWAVLCAGLAFYSYSAATAVVALTAALLFFSDVRYHWRQRMTVLAASGLASLLALPYLRFMLQHPTATRDHLVMLDSYWIKPLPLVEKLGLFLTQYGRGLNPIYWYQTGVVDFPRHVMKGYGYLLWATFPLLLIGLAVMVWKIHQSRCRTVLIALLAAPCGAAMVEIGITRVLTMVVPAAILSAIGLSYVLRWTERLLKWAVSKQPFPFGKRPYSLRKQPSSLPAGAVAGGRWKIFSLIPLLVFALLAGYNIYMLWDTQVNGPLWFSDYGINGMQYGANQVFAEVRQYLVVSPDTQIILSPTWANGTDVLARFFFNDPAPFSLGSIQGYLTELMPLDQHTLFIMTPDEFNLAQASGKFQHILVEKTILYPDGAPGFYLVRLRYVDNIAAIMAKEQAARRIPQEADVVIGGQLAHVKYSYLDMGDINMAFDGDINTLMRSMEANPFKLEIDFVEPQRLHGVTVQVGGVPTRLQVELHPAADATLVQAPVFSTTVPATPDPRPVVLDFGGTFEVSGISLEVQNVLDSEPSHVHVWEVTFK
jgi:4-amino-4-deoxy-L-arabinose transferase-like glycosyltransferase